MNPTPLQPSERAACLAARAKSRQPFRLRLDASDSTGRPQLEHCIARRFADQHDARIDEFLPWLLSIGTDEQLNAVVGLRPASEETLFLEQYLDVPVEQAISREFLTPVDRGDIVEIGNLAANVPGETYALFAVLARALYLSGYRWVVCTATLQIEAMLATMRFPSQAICRADPTCLGERAHHWGSYYSSRPRVITGDVRVANELLNSTPALLALTRQLAGQIDEVASSLTAAR